MSFIRDLEEWQLYESRILDFLAKSYPIMRLAHNPKRLDIDLLSPLGVNVEVKFDRRMEETGNIFIEFECNWKRSWIFKYDNLHIFAYWNNNEFFLFNANKLKKDIAKFIEDKTYRVVSWGDGWRSKWVLLPIKDLIPKGIAARGFSLNNF